MHLSFGVSSCSQRLLYRPRLKTLTVTDRDWIRLHTQDFSSLFSIAKQQFQLWGYIPCWHRWLYYTALPHSRFYWRREVVNPWSFSWLSIYIYIYSMDACDSLCPNKQTIQDTAQSTRCLNRELRFAASQNPIPALAPSQVSLNFMSLLFLMLLLMQGLKLANVLMVNLVSFLLWQPWNCRAEHRGLFVFCNLSSAP